MGHCLSYTSSKCLPAPLKSALASPGHNTCGCGCKVLEEPPDSGEQRCSSMSSMWRAVSILSQTSRPKALHSYSASYSPPKCGGLGPLGHASPQRVQPELSSSPDSSLESSGECLRSTWRSQQG